MFHEAENLKNSKNIFSLRRKNCRLRKVIKKGLEKFEESCINFLIFFILKSWLFFIVGSNENDKFKLRLGYLKNLKNYQFYGFLKLCDVGNTWINLWFDLVYYNKLYDL